MHIYIIRYMHVGWYSLIRGSNVIVIGFTSLKYEHVLLTLEGRCSSSYSYTALELQSYSSENY